MQQIILKGEAPLDGRPGATLPSVDFEAVRKELADKGAGTTDEDVIAHCLYAKVFSDYSTFKQEYSDVSVLDTPTFFFGMKRGETIEVTIEKGKTLMIKYIQMSEADEDGTRHVLFELNGQPRTIKIHDKHIKTTGVVRHKIDPTKPGEVGATLSGSVVKIVAQVGQAVKKGDPLVVTEAMKMETTITAPVAGVVGIIHVREGSRIESGDCLLTIEEQAHIAN